MALGTLLLLLLIGHTALHQTEATLRVIAQPAEISAPLGGPIVLPCSFTLDSTINAKYLAVMWHFKNNVIVRSDNKEESQHSRMFITKSEILRGRADLTIRNVTVADAGKYDCNVIYAPDNRVANVQLKVYSPPTVTVETTEEDGRFAVCSAEHFYPRDIKVEILKDGQWVEDPEMTEYPNADGTYSNHVKIPLDKEAKTLTCLVHHISSGLPLQKELHLFHDGADSVGVIVGCVVGALILVIVIIAVWYFKYKPGHEKFIVGSIEGPGWMDGEKTTLTCKASRCTGDVQVTWVIQSKDGTRLEVTEASSEDREELQPLMSREYLVTKEKLPHGRGNIHDVITTLSFIPSISRHAGSTMLCRLIHEKKEEERTYQSKSLYAKPKFMEPVRFSLSERGEVFISVTFQSFYPEGLEVGWLSKKGNMEERMPSEETQSPSGDMFNLESKCAFPGELFREPGFRVIVKWSHKSLEEGQSRELTTRDLPWSPKLHNIPIETVFHGDEVHLQCRLSDYFPDALAVRWYEKIVGSQEVIDASSLQRYTIPEITPTKTKNQTFSSTAILCYKRTQLVDPGVEFICRVEHPSLDKPIQNNVLQYRDTEPLTLILNNIQGPQTWYHDEKVTLYCAASYCKEDTRVIWMVEAVGGMVYEVMEDEAGDTGQSSRYAAHREKTDMSDTEGVQDVTSSLSFTPSVSQHRNVTITCKIMSEGKGKQKLFQPKNIFAKPKVVSPINLQLTDTGEVLCSLDIEGFYPGDIQIKWNDMENPNQTAQSIDGTFSTRSKCLFPGSFFSHRNSAVRVSWKHVSMEDWESRQLPVLDKDFPWKPIMKDIPVPNLVAGSTVTLKCEVSNVFPDVLHVKWLKKERGSEASFPLTSDRYNVSEPSVERQRDNTFTYRTCLKMTPDISTDEGAELICMVEHPALERPLKKSTGPLTIKALKVAEPSPKKDTQQNSTPQKIQNMADHTPPQTELKVAEPSPKKDTQQNSIPQNIQYMADPTPPQTEEKIFVIGDIQAPAYWIHGERVTLYCSVSYCPEDTGVIWRVEATDGKSEEIPCNGERPVTSPSGYTVTKEKERSDKEGLCNLTNEMNLVPSVSRHLGVKIICQITINGCIETKKFTPQSLYANLQVLEPVKTTMNESGDVLCSLNFLNFYPKHLKATWTAGDSTLKSAEDYEKNNDKTFNARSHCTIPGNLFLDPTFTLRVTWSHKSLDEPQSEELSWRSLGAAWCPKVEEVPIPHVLIGQRNTLQYNISCYFPDAVTVSWCKKKKGDQKFTALSGGEVSKSQRQPDNTYSCTARLAFTPSPSDEGSEFMCRVTHPSLERPIEKSTGGLHVQGKPKPKARRSTLDREEVKFSQSLENFYPGNIQVEWHCWSEVREPQSCPSQEKLSKNIDNTFSVTSECKIPETLPSSPDFRLRVTWRHESMDDPESRELSIKDLPWHPNVELSVPPLRSGEEATIECKVKKYFPGAVAVTWHRRDRESGILLPVSTDETYRVSNSPHDRQSDNTYSCVSSLILCPSLEKDQGVEYVCRVEHPSLALPIERSSGALHITAASQEDKKSPDLSMDAVNGTNQNQQHPQSDPSAPPSRQSEAASQEDKKSPDLYMDAVNGTNQNQQHSQSDPSAPPSRQSEAGTQEDRKLPETRMDTGEGMNQNLQPAQSDPSAHLPQQSDPSAHLPRQSEDILNGEKTERMEEGEAATPDSSPPPETLYENNQHYALAPDPAPEESMQHAQPGAPLSNDILNGEKTERMEEGEAATPDSNPPPETLYENNQHYAFAPDPAPEESMQHAQPGATLSNAPNGLDPFIKEEPDMRGARGPGTADIQDQEMEETSEETSVNEMESDKEPADDEESRMPRKSRTSERRTQSQHPKKERKALYKTHERMRKSKDTPDGPAKMQPSDNTLWRAQQELADSL